MNKEHWVLGITQGYPNQYTAMNYDRNPGEHVAAAFWIMKRTHIGAGSTVGERETESPNLQAISLQVRSCKTSCKSSKVKTKTGCDNVSVY